MISKKIIASALALAMTASTFAFAVNSGNTNLFGASSVMANAEISGDYTYTILDDGSVEITKYAGTEQDLTIPSTIDGIKVTTIGKNSFYNRSTLKSVIVPDGVTKIAEHSFKSCKNLENVSLPNGVVSIGRNAFYSCSNLKNINIPNSVKTIGDYAFHNCKSLANIDLPNSIESLGEELFFGCSSLTSVELPDSLTTIPYGLFDTCRNLKTVKIPSSITSISDWAFHECTGLENIEIPSTVKSIGKDAFFDCTSLKSITIPEGVTEISKNAFYGCSSLTSIEIPNTVTTIGLGAFHSCLNLTNVTIPNSVTKVGDKAFYDCPSLLTVKVPQSVEIIGDYAFGYSRDKNTPIKMTDYKLDCYPDSAAEQYAKENGLVYEFVDDSEHTHIYTSKVVPPTTTSQGYTEHTCSICGDSYKDTFTDPIVEEKAPEVKLMLQKSGDGKYSRFILQVKLSDMLKADTASYAITANGKTSTTNITNFYSAYKIGSEMHKAPSGYGYVISEALYGIKTGDSITVKLSMSNFNAPYTKTITVR